MKKIIMYICCVLIMGMKATASDTAKITTEWQGMTETIQVAASVSCPDTIWRGMLEKDNIQSDILDMLFGEQEMWEKKAGEANEAGGETWEYANTPIRCWIWENNLSFSILNRTISTTEEFEKLFQGQQEAEPEELLGNISEMMRIGGLLNQPVEDVYGYKVDAYEIQGMIQGARITDYCRGRFGGTINLTNGKISELHIGYLLKETEKETVEILPLEEILENAQEYVKNGFVNAPPSGEAVSLIELKYYVDQEQEGYSFRPVWAFHVSKFFGNEVTEKMHELFCIDACTGALVSYKGV